MSLWRRRPRPTTRRIQERVLAGQRLGRHVHHDPRSRAFLAEQAIALRDVKHATHGLPLDQGSVGSCTAEALTGAGNSDPNLKTGSVPRDQQDAYHLYHVETQLEHDVWPPNDPGGTGLMVCKAAKRLGWIGSYRHAFGLQQSLHALVLRPVIFGFDWYEGFDSPDANGLVEIAGQIRGGHEVLATEILLARQLVGFENSWGPSYGLGGRFYMSFGTVGRLLADQGDCTVPHFLGAGLGA